MAERLRDYPNLRLWTRSDGTRPALVGRRLEVRHIVDTVHASGSEEAAADYLEIDATLVREAMRYYRAHREQVDAWIAEHRRVADVAEQAWLRAHRHLPS